MSLRILLVDDNPLIRDTVRSYIERQTDWQICGEAEDGRQAIEKAKEFNPDTIILDFQMPKMNGLDAAKEISKMLSNVSIFLYTMHASEHLQKVATASGVKSVISKSSTLDDLILTIKTSLP